MPERGGFALDMGAGLDRQLATLMPGLKNLQRKVKDRVIPIGEQIVVKAWREEVSGTGSEESLGVRTGDFRRRIRRLERGAVGTDHPGAAIHEFGGVILPKAGPYLTFEVEPGKWVSVTRVTMPKRPHRAPAHDAAQPKVAQVLHDVAMDEIGKTIQRVKQAEDPRAR